MAERSAVGRRLSSRFVAGTQVEDALRVTQAVNRAGLSVSVDNLGENVTNADEARDSAQLYHQMLDQVSSRQLNANVSLKLTHMGLDVDEKLAAIWLPDWWRLARPSRRLKNFVGWTWKAPLHAADPRFRPRTTACPVTRARSNAVISLYHGRGGDIENLPPAAEAPACKRGVQGPDKSHQKSEVDANYVRLMKVLMSGVYHGLATHDESIIDKPKLLPVEQIPPNL
jgi:proline dehydrogenase